MTQTIIHRLSVILALASRDMTSDTLILATTAATAVTVATPGLQPAGACLTVLQVRNSNAGLPSLADPPDLMVPFKDWPAPDLPDGGTMVRTIAAPLVVTTSAFTRCQISANR